MKDLTPAEAYQYIEQLLPFPALPPKHPDAKFLNKAEAIKKQRVELNAEILVRHYGLTVEYRYYPDPDLEDKQFDRALTGEVFDFIFWDKKSFGGSVLVLSMEKRVITWMEAAELKYYMLDGYKARYRCYPDMGNDFFDFIFLEDQQIYSWAHPGIAFLVSGSEIKRKMLGGITGVLLRRNQ